MSSLSSSALDGPDVIALVGVLGLLILIWLMMFKPF